MTLPLFGDTPGRRHGPVRLALDAQLAAAAAAGVDLGADLAVIAQSLADRIDAANVTGERRGFVLLTGEYRQARAELLAPLTAQGVGDDSFADALAAFRAAAGDDAEGPVTAQ